MARNSAAALNASFNSFFASSFSFSATDEDAVAAFAARVPFDTEPKSFSSGCFTICTSTSTSRLAAGAFDLGFDRLGGGGKSSGSSAPMAYAKYATSTAPAAATNGVRLAVCCSSCPPPALDEDEAEADAAAGTAELAPLFGLDNGSRSAVAVTCAASTSAAAGGGTTGFTPTCTLVASALTCAAARCSAKTDSCNGNFAAEACGNPRGAAPFIFGGGLYFLGASAVTNFHFPNPTALYPTSFNTDSCNGVFIASTCGNARVRPCGGFALLEIFGVVELAAVAPAAFFVVLFVAGFFFAAAVLVVVVAAFFVVVVGFFVAVAYVATR